MTAGNQPSSSGGATLGAVKLDEICLQIQGTIGWSNGADFEPDCCSCRECEAQRNEARDAVRLIASHIPSVAQRAPDQRLTEDMTLAHNARKTAIEECARVATRAARRCVRERLPGDSVAAYIEREILALSAVTPSPGAGEWQPIDENTPRDGTPIEACNTRHPSHAPVVVRWKACGFSDVLPDPYWCDAATADGSALYFNENFFDFWKPTTALPASSPVPSTQERTP